MKDYIIEYKTSDSEDWRVWANVRYRGIASHVAKQLLEDKTTNAVDVRIVEVSHDPDKNFKGWDLTKSKIEFKIKNGKADLFINDKKMTGEDKK